MAKQIKIGFDSVPAPVTLQYPQLLDIFGNPLLDDAGNPLLTEEEGTLTSFTSARNSLSTHVNNPSTIPLKVVEQFPETSTVSSSILGVPKSETQLSLFSDVSTYGINKDDWNYYTFRGIFDYPSAWYNRKNPIFGKRQFPQFYEAPNEQALLLKSFPTQYSFPFPPGDASYNSNNWERYVKFIAAGKFLYGRFSGETTFIRNNLISDNVNFIDLDGNPVDVTFDAVDFVSDTEYSNIIVTYGDDLDSSFEEIERFTQFWNKIVSNEAIFPELSGSSETDYTLTTEYPNLRSAIVNQTRPGYSSNYESFAVLESKKTFRYQPGRVSGFTFGVRMKTDLSSLNNFIEWGAANETDQYMFQITGARLNIIRRSTIKLPDSLLERMGLDSSYQRQVYPVDLNNDNPILPPEGNQSGTHYELKIPRDNFNGDRLDGTGPSGYTMSFEDVTMYKIEFSWYGAIGVKFYAYIPTGNGDARWALIHTLVIENGLGEPILKNPDMKFRYTLFSQDVGELTEPIYIYKYGASYYIDGGDEGTITLSTKTSDTKQVVSNDALMAILPKNDITSSYESTDLKNYKKLYPDTVTVSSDKNCRIDIKEVIGSSDGFHFYYTPSLRANQNSKTIVEDFVIVNNNTEIQYVNTNLSFSTADDGAKIIADGVYNAYVSSSTTSSSVIKRLRSRGDLTEFDFGFDYEVRELSDKILKQDGTEFDGSIPFSARITNFNSVAASTVPINANRFKIHFLNPQKKDGTHGNAHFAEFAVSVIGKEPFLDATNNNVLRFDQSNPIEFNVEDTVHVKWSQLEELVNLERYEVTEHEPLVGDRLEKDFRVRNDELPRGGNSGLVSVVEGEVITVEYDVESFDSGTNTITFAAGVNPGVILNDGGEVGIDTVATGINFVGNVFTQGTGGNLRYKIVVNGDLSNGGTIDLTATGIQVKIVRLKSAWEVESYTQTGTPRFIRQSTWRYEKVDTFDIQPLYLVFAMRENAEVNNIIVEEIYSEGTLTHTPKFIWGDDDSITLSTVSTESENLAPSNFTSDERLSGVRFDTQTQQPMRPGETIYSFFVSANEPQRIKLSNIFAQDRKSSTIGLYNNRAYYFIGTTLDGTTSNVDIALTVKEQ